MPDYYSDSSGADNPSPAPESKTPPKDTEGETALLPKSILAGKKFEVGEEVVLKIVHEYEDEIEVAYASSDKPEEDSENPDLAKAHADMEQMASE